MADIMESAKQKMQAALEHLKTDLKSLRTNRANAAMLDSVVVEMFGSQMPLKSLANVTAPESRQIVITPFDPKTTSTLAQALEKSHQVPFSLIAEGHMIRINVPPMDEAMRREIVKSCKKKGEDSKITIRDARHKAKDLLKKGKADGEIPEDRVKKHEKDLQDLTDRFCKEIDDLVAIKEKEILTV